MRTILAIALALLLPLNVAAQWQEGTIVGTWTKDSDDPSAFFISTLSPLYQPTPGVWATFDVTTLGVPADVKSVFLAGVLVITGGNGPVQDCDLTMSFRAPGSTLGFGNFIMQTVTVSPLGGIGTGSRSNAASWVPVVNGKFEWGWGRGDAYQWPAGALGSFPTQCAYGVNLVLQAYSR